MEVLVWDKVRHPLYYPDIVLLKITYFFLLAFLAKKRLSKIKDFVGVASDFSDSKPPWFWEKGTADLSSRWKTVVSNGGSYNVE